MINIPKNLGMVLTVLMLLGSNLFMTFAWYWHLRLQKPGEAGWPRIAIILTSWLIALVEYMIAVPANRLGISSGFNVAQLKIIQEVISLSVFSVFSVLYLREEFKWNYLAAFLCILVAVILVMKK